MEVMCVLLSGLFIKVRLDTWLEGVTLYRMAPGIRIYPTIRRWSKPFREAASRYNTAVYSVIIRADYAEDWVVCGFSVTWYPYPSRLKTRTTHNVESICESGAVTLWTGKTTKLKSYLSSLITILIFGFLSEDTSSATIDVPLTCVILYTIK